MVHTKNRQVYKKTRDDSAEACLLLAWLAIFEGPNETVNCRHICKASSHTYKHFLYNFKIGLIYLDISTLRLSHDCYAHTPQYIKGHITPYHTNAWIPVIARPNIKAKLPVSKFSTIQVGW